MWAVPLFLVGLPVITYALTDPRQEPRGGWAEFVRGERFAPAGLAICRDSKGGGFYLFGCDADWNAVTDSWHQTLEDALDQAEYEHPDIGERWIRV